jgi:hypothetical protein
MQGKLLVLWQIIMLMPSSPKGPEVIFSLGPVYKLPPAAIKSAWLFIIINAVISVDVILASFSTNPGFPFI